MGVADRVEQEIKAWIQQAVEPKDKALLMILFQMNSNLTENTAVTKSVAADFHTHKEKIDSFLNRVRGGWMVLGFGFLIVQGLGMWIVNTQLNNIDKEAMRNQTQELAIIRLQAENSELMRRVNNLEQYLSGNPR